MNLQCTLSKKVKKIRHMNQLVAQHPVLALASLERKKMTILSIPVGRNKNCLQICGGARCIARSAARSLLK